MATSCQIRETPAIARRFIGRPQNRRTKIAGIVIYSSAWDRLASVLCWARGGLGVLRAIAKRCGESGAGSSRGDKGVFRREEAGRV
jgi:hypothetical protein